MKKSKSKGPPAIPATVMARLRQSFQKPAAADLSCPEPERVISYALEELAVGEERPIRDHLLTCRDCLELFLDVRLARAEATIGEGLEDLAAAEQRQVQDPLSTCRDFPELYPSVSPSPAGPEVTAGEGLIGISPEKPPKLGWRAAVGSKLRQARHIMSKPRRLIPALAAVSLVVCLVILGRQESSRVLPPPQPQLALKQQASPTTSGSGAPAPEARAAKPSPPARSGMLPPESEAETMALSSHKAAGAKRALSEPLRLDLAAVPADGARLSYRANRSVYAYLLRQDRSGKTTLVHSGRLEAGKTYYYPAKDRLLKADTGAAAATVFFVASPEPIVDLQTKLEKVARRGTDRMQDFFPGATIRSLSIRLP